jgi:predicted pyridoxine 5'-phosphate oxidase superfamily flavin-nucleotide-binding protein
MGSHLQHLLTSPASIAAQMQYYGRAQKKHDPTPDQLGAAEAEFVSTRDSFYLSTIAENGWPYIQHRGGPPGFLRVAGADELVFADLSGNRQLLSTGNLAGDDRVALFLMDYPQRSRLKILGHARSTPTADEPALAQELAWPGSGKVERIMRIRVVGFDWNCPKYITPRYTLQDIEPLRTRIAELEAALVAARASAPAS